MMAAGTIDEDIYRLIEKKRLVVNQAIDGDLIEDISAADIIGNLLGDLTKL
jgi:SNF2 family DNA or RNA helicase